MAGRTTGRLMRPMLRRMRPEMLRRNEGMLLVAHPERLTDDYLEVAAAGHLLWLDRPEGAAQAVRDTLRPAGRGPRSRPATPDDV